MTTLAAFFNVGPRPSRRALKGLFISAFNFAMFALLDWLFPSWLGHSNIDWSFDWAFGVGVFFGYFFWGND